ncbi:hypothetical protein [Enterococcus sp. BWR-S5]|uniref:hypothetical protein n=1 Tax=Enterococcus sp. BWR-S5 TaxID=2787714 RepID=UPI001923D7DB|nr:hypothetical protein [Enterococcus sp. BWR-S5]MBL1226584.1 hypothetical protein [Enterococcus sp. BWR-S5]
MKRKMIRILQDVALMSLLGLSFRASLSLGFLSVVIWVAVGITNEPKKIKVNGKERKIIN